jgi:SAM-dependent methyltransferase
MDIGSLRGNWEQFAAEDPLWAILTDPSKRGGKWDPADFFLTGEHEITAVFERAGGLPSSKRRALDFGCGVGRLSQAIARRFDHTVGVDISAKMIELAGQFNAVGDRCSYVQNDRPDLTVLGDQRFDFIYSNIVLQHMPSELALGYVREMVRLLAEGGLLVFQMPERLTLSTALRQWLQSKPGPRQDVTVQGPVMEMHGTRRSRVLAQLAGGRLIRVERDGGAGPEWVGFRYWVTRG